MALRIDLADLDEITREHAPHLAPASNIRPFAYGSPESSAALAQPPPEMREASMISAPTTLTAPREEKIDATRSFKPGIASSDEVGSPGFFRQKIADIEQKRKTPWGSPDNHPGFLGKVAHGLATAGNLAGELLAPNFTSMIPGSQLNMDTREAEANRDLQKAEQEETARKGVEQKADIAGEKSKQANQKELDALAEHGLTRDEQGNVVPLPPEKLSATARQKLEDSQKLDAYRQAQTQLAEANEELKRSQNDPKSPQFQMAMKKLQMAQLAHQIAASNLGLHEQEFENKVHEQGIVKPSGQAQSRGSAAQAALDVLPELEQQIRTNASQLGPIFGRLAKGEIAIGDVPPNIAKLYSSLTSFYALNPAIHGFRNFEFVKDMPSFIGGLERDPESTIAGLEGLRPTLNSVAKEGKTFHKRIVEGEEGGGELKPPKEADPGMKWQHRTVNGKVEWRQTKAQ